MLPQRYVHKCKIGAPIWTLSVQIHDIGGREVHNLAIKNVRLSCKKAQL